MKHKKIKIDRLDGGFAAAAFPGSNGGTSAPAGGSSSAGSSSGSSAGTSGSASGGASAGGGSPIGGNTAGAGGDVSVVTVDNGGTTTGQTTAPAYTNNTTSNQSRVGAQDSEVVALATGDTVTMGDLLIAIQEYYNRDKVSEKDISRALSDPAFLDFLQQKIKNAKKNKVSLREELATASVVSPAGEAPNDNTQGNPDSWTRMCVTMKKAWWIFMGAAVGLLLTIIVSLAIAKKK